MFFCRRIFWLGDLNYRIDVPYDRTHGLIAAMDWPQLAEKDQVRSFVHHHLRHGL